ncbi:MAG TPA: YIP1 family protein [Bacillota bacterium]
MIEVLYNPLKAFGHSINTRKIILNIFLVLLIALVFQSIAINKIVNLSDFQQLAELPENFPTNIIVAFATGFQLFMNFVNIIILSLIFKFVGKITQMNINFKFVFYIIVLSQIPVLMSILLNSFFINSFNDGEILSIFGLGYFFSFFIDNSFILKLLNTVEIFQLWSAFIIAAGFYSVTKKYTFKKTMIIIFGVYFITNIFLTSIL